MQYDEKTLTNRGKELSFLLRHDKEYKFDKNGWRTVQDLVENHDYTFDLIEQIVETNNKKRYEFNDDKTLIRARQGHSVDVDVQLEEVTPPCFLFHGTDEDAAKHILKEGIKPMQRLHVHLSPDVKTAEDVANRHTSGGKKGISILVVDTEAMRNDGIKFYYSNNGVWLTDYVDPKYIVRPAADCIFGSSPWNDVVGVMNTGLMQLNNDKDAQWKYLKSCLEKLVYLEHVSPEYYKHESVQRWYEGQIELCGLLEQVAESVRHIGKTCFCAYAH